MGKNLYAEMEDDLYNLYDEKSELLGSINFSSFSKPTLIFTDSKNYILNHNKKRFELFLDDDTILNFKFSSLWGSLKILELNKTIKGVWGLKWATQLVDQNKKSLLKIRNQNSFLDKKKYEILLLDANTTTLEILLTLFMHLYGSKVKSFIASNV